MTNQMTAIIEQLNQLEKRLSEQHPSLLSFLPLIKLQFQNATKPKAAYQSAGKTPLKLLRLALTALRRRLFRKSPPVPIDFLLVEHGVKRYVNWEGQYLNPLLDSTAEFLQERGQALSVEYYDDPDQYRATIYNQQLVDWSLLLIKANGLFQVKKHLGLLPDHQSVFQEILACARAAGLNLLSFSVEALNDQYNRILIIQQLCEQQLRRYRPQIVFNFCYYSNLAFALTLAAKKENITTVEIQHGTQGEGHIMYSGYYSASNYATPLLPDYFWAWSKIEYDYCLAWLQGSPYHKVLRSGHPYLLFYQQKRRLTTTSSRGKGPLQVLITLQEPNLFRDSFLDELIRSAGSDITWILRTHPLYPDFREELDKQYEALDQVAIHTAKEKSFYDVLLQVDINITAFSTTCLEALDFGVPSVIIHPSGEKSFAYYISQGIFHCATDAKSCLDLLQNGVFEPPSSGLLKTDPLAMDSALRTVTTQIRPSYPSS